MGLLLVAALATILVASFSSVTMASERHLLAPSTNQVAGRIMLPHQVSVTLSARVGQWLRSQGISYVIPRVPAGFPPVKALPAAQAAAAQTPVGAHPTVRELALISPVTALHPLEPHSIVWAVVLARAAGPRDAFYVTFVETQTPKVIGSIHAFL
jgi:hypothetical protein